MNARAVFGRFQSLTCNRILRRTVTLHDLEELDNDLGAGADQDLTLSSLLGVVDGVERIVEDGSADHVGGLSSMEILKSGDLGNEVSAKRKRS